MRDLLPEETRERRALASRVLERLELFGYDLVLLPAFEFADVLERGLGALDPSEVLRFVEPESGEIAALRPDMTPQIARLVATRLGSRPPPFRLAYEGTVVRRWSGRARKRRQLPQVGVELVGEPAQGERARDRVSLAYDLEILELAAAVFRAVGLDEFVIDLGDAGIVRALLSDVEAGAASAIADAVGRKDELEVGDRMRDAGADPALLLELLRARTVDDGVALLAKTKAVAPAERLRALHAAAVSCGLGDHVTADLGELRSAAYYTGMLFRAYARGAADAIGSGGRYDDSLGRFGAPMPAVGFGIDLDALAVAVRAASPPAAGRRRVLVLGDEAEARRLRDAGVAAAVRHERDGAVEYANAWGYTEVLDPRKVP